MVYTTDKMEYRVSKVLASVHFQVSVGRTVFVVNRIMHRREDAGEL